MKKETLDTVMTLNPDLISGNGSRDITPRFVGEFKSGRTRRGVLVWWNRYRVEDNERVQVLMPIIGGEIDGERFQIDNIVIEPDRRTMSGRVRLSTGYELSVAMRLKTDQRRKKGDQKRVFALIRLGEVWIERFEDAPLMPANYFFPEPD